MEPLQQIGQWVATFFAQGIKRNPRVWVISAVAAALFLAIGAIASLFRRAPIKEVTVKKSPFSKLPPEMMEKILKQQDGTSLVQLSRVSKEMHGAFQAFQESSFNSDLETCIVLHEAKVCAREIWNPETRASILARICVQQVKKGNAAEARKTLADMEEAIDKTRRFYDPPGIIRYEWVDTLGHLAIAYASMGEIEQARHWASKAGKTKPHMKIAKWQLEKGQVANAKQSISLALGCSNSIYQKTKILSKSGKLLGKHQLFTQAKESARLQNWLGPALAIIALDQAESGDRVGAEETFREARAAGKINPLLIVRVLAAIGKKEEAERIVREKTLLEKNFASLLLQLQVGRIDEAETTAHQIIHLNQAQTVGVLDRIFGLWKRIFRSNDLIDELMRLKTRKNVSALAKLAHAQEKQGRPQKAKWTLVEAKKLAMRLDTSRRALALLRIAKGLAS